MIIYISFSKEVLLVRSLSLRPEELLIALPGPATIKQTRYIGPEKIATQSIIFPAHKAIREYPGLGRFIPARRVETWVFALRVEEYPTFWDAQLGLLNPNAPRLKLARVRVGEEYLRVLKVKAADHEVHLTLPAECTLAPFQETEVGLEPNLFDKAFGEELAL